MRAKIEIAKILKRMLEVRDYPYTDEDVTDPKRILQLGITRGFNHGMSLALALLVLEEKKLGKSE